MKTIERHFVMQHVAQVVGPRGKAPGVCLAQPNGLGASSKTRRKGQRPGSLLFVVHSFTVDSNGRTLGPTTVTRFMSQPVGLG